MKKIIFPILLITMVLSGCSSLDDEDISVRCSECGKEFYVNEVERVENDYIVDIEVHDMHDASRYEDLLSWYNGYGVLDPDVVEEVLYENLDVETAEKLLDEMFSNGYTDLSEKSEPDTEDEYSDFEQDLLNQLEDIDDNNREIAENEINN